jgi:biotin carboxyl carrier protein
MENCRSHRGRESDARHEEHAANMKLHASIADEVIDVEVRREGERVIGVVDGRKYELNLQQTARSYVLRSDGSVFDCRVDGQVRSGETVDVFVGTERFPVMFTDPKRLRGSADAAGLGDGAARIVAPMPGKIVRVLVEVGAQLEAGAGVVVVEAMKMQNEMKSPKAGTVSAVNVEVGATVNGGDVLAVIE